MQASGGLFGTAATPGPLTFGGSSQPAVAAPAPSTPGLFGGLSGSQPRASNSLFGSTIGAPHQGGLPLKSTNISPFGASPAPTPSTSLFEAPRIPGSENSSSSAIATAATASSGLLGQSRTGAGLFGSSSPGGPSSAFGDQGGDRPASGLFGAGTGGGPSSSNCLFRCGSPNAAPPASSGVGGLVASPPGGASTSSAGASVFEGRPTVNRGSTLFGPASKGVAPPSLFGAGAPGGGLFSQTSEAQAPRGNIFGFVPGGGPPTATAAGGSLQPAPVASGAPVATKGVSSLFGGFGAGPEGPSASRAPASTGLLGGTATGPSAFGNTNSSSSNILFGVAPGSGALGTTVFGISKGGEAPKDNADGVASFGAPAATGLFGGGAAVAGVTRSAATAPSAGLFSGTQGPSTSGARGGRLLGGPSAGRASVPAFASSSNALFGPAASGGSSALSSSTGTGESVEGRGPASGGLFSAGNRSSLLRGFFEGRKAGESASVLSGAAPPNAPSTPLQRSSSGGGSLFCSGPLRDGGGPPCSNQHLSAAAESSSSSSGMIAVHGRSKLCVPEGAAVPPPLPEPPSPHGNPMLRGSLNEGSLMLRVQVVQQLQPLLQEGQSNAGGAGGLTVGSDSAAASGGGGPFVGQLYRCCSTEEMLDKQQVSTASDFERLDATVPGDPEARIVNVHLAFASFRRSDAGKPFKQSDTRPAVWCRRAVHALLTYCADADLTNGPPPQQQQPQPVLPRKEYLYPRSRPYTYMDVYNFLRDRLRACWQELTVQHVSPHRASIETLEISFRFLVLSEELLAGAPGFDAVSNHGLMQTCLDKLMQGYEAARAFRSKRDATAVAAAAAAAATAAAAARGSGGGLGPDELLDLLVFSSPYEGEFWGFRLLMLLAQEASDTALVSLLQRLPPQLQQDPSVRFSFSAYRAFKALDLRRYVRLMREGPYLLCLLLHKFLPFGRARFLAALVTGRLAGGARNPISAQRLSVLMGFDGEDEALFLSFLKAYGIRTSVSPRGVSICLLDEIDKGLLQDLSSYKKAKGPRAPSAFLLAPQLVSRQQLLDPDYPADIPAAAAAAAAVGATQQQRRPTAAELSRAFYFRYKERFPKQQHGQQQQQQGGFYRQERLQRLQEQQRLKLQQQRQLQALQPREKDAQQQLQQQQQQEQQQLLLQYSLQQQKQKQQLQQEQLRQLRDRSSIFSFGTQGPQEATSKGAASGAAAATTALAGPERLSLFGECMQEDRAELSQQQQQQQQHTRWQQQQKIQQQQPQQQAQQQQGLPSFASTGGRQQEQKQAPREQWTKQQQLHQEQQQQQRHPLFSKEVSSVLVGPSGLGSPQGDVGRRPAAVAAASAAQGAAAEGKQSGATSAPTGFLPARPALLFSAAEAAGKSSVASQPPRERMDSTVEQPLKGAKARPAETAPAAAVGAAASMSRVAPAGSTSPELPRSRGQGSPVIAVRDGGTSSGSLKSGAAAAFSAGAKAASSDADALEPSEVSSEAGSHRGGPGGIVGLRHWRGRRRTAEDKQDTFVTLSSERPPDKGAQTPGASGGTTTEKETVMTEMPREAGGKPQQQSQRKKQERARSGQLVTHAGMEERVGHAVKERATDILQGGVGGSVKARTTAATRTDIHLSEVGADEEKTEGALAARSLEDDLLLLLKQQTEWPRQPLPAAVAAAVAAAAAHEGGLNALLSPAEQRDARLYGQPRLFFKAVIYCRRAAAVEALLVRILATAACARLPSGTDSFPPVLLRGKLTVGAAAAAPSGTAAGACLGGSLLLWSQQAISLPRLLLPLPVFCALHAVGGVRAEGAAVRKSAAPAALEPSSQAGQDKIAYELDLDEVLQDAAMLLLPLPFLVALPPVFRGPAAFTAAACVTCGSNSLPTVVLQPAGGPKGSQTSAAAAGAATQQWAAAAAEVVRILKQQQQQQHRQAPREGGSASLAVVFALSLQQGCFGTAASAAQAASPFQQEQPQQHQQRSQQLVVSVDDDVRLACSAVRSQIYRAIAARHPEYSAAAASLRVRCVCVVPECASSTTSSSDKATTCSSSSCIDGICCTEKALPLSEGLLQCLSLDPWEALTREGFLQSLLRQRPQPKQQQQLLVSAWGHMWESSLNAAAAAAEARARQLLRDGFAAQLRQNQPQQQPLQEQRRQQEQQRQQQCGLDGASMEELVAFSAAQQVAHVAADATVSAEAFRAAAAAAAGTLHSCSRHLWRLPPAEWLLSLLARLQQQQEQGETIADADRAACFPSTDIEVLYELMLPSLEQQRGRRRQQGQQEILRVLRQIYSKPAALKQLLRLAEAADVKQWQQRKQQHLTIREVFAAALESAERCAAAAVGKAAPLVLPFAAACQLDASPLQWWGPHPLPRRLLITAAALQQQREQAKDLQQRAQQPQQADYTETVQKKYEQDRQRKRVLRRQASPLSVEGPQRLRQRLCRSVFRLTSECMRLAAEDSQSIRALLESLKL
ncbi:hypothetical protein ACSSS7_003469 [Eimeria intestinalis]